MNDSAGLDERPVEEALRTILDALDRQLARAAMLFPLTLLTLLPLVFFGFWLGLDWTARRSVVLAGGAGCALLVGHLTWEMLVTRWALWRFERQFPAYSPSRMLALRILGELETPSRAEEKLRLMLSSFSLDRIVRHRREGEASPLETPPPVTETTPPAEMAPRPGGYYDYMPLEPRPDSSSPSSQMRG